MIKKVLFLLCCVFYLVEGLEEDDPCSKNGVPGTCINIRKCQSAIEDIKRRINPQICSFQGTDPVVCCLHLTTTTASPPLATTSTTITPSIDLEEIPTYDYVNKDGTTVENCEPIDPSLTSPKTGQKAWDKCLEYQQKCVYPCENGVNLAGGLSRANNCHHNADELILGGENANEDEFPHMVLLGYGNRIENVQWQCGGSLISESFVLTAGHCTVSRDGGPVTYALMGVLKRTQIIDSSKLRRIKRHINGPGYNPPHRYHDIALLEMESPVKLDQFLVPACLHVANDSVQDERASATGWGLTENRGSVVADNLQKVILTKFTDTECREKFPSNRLLKQGFDTATQICYGDHKVSKDTCQGDSGGPLQIKSKPIHCMYVIIGVTSFGKACGVAGDPGIYTRVSQYVPWIESLVWP